MAECHNLVLVEEQHFLLFERNNNLELTNFISLDMENVLKIRTDDLDDINLGEDWIINL